jgi:hypothetical protein
MKPPTVVKIVAVGTWIYDGVAQRRITISARPAEFAGSRYVEAEPLGFLTPDGFVLDPAKPVPKTPDGFVYYVGATSGGEFASLADAKAWAEAQPWAPIKWDD